MIELSDSNEEEMRGVRWDDAADWLPYILLLGGEGVGGVEGLYCFYEQIQYFNMANYISS